MHQRVAQLVPPPSCFKSLLRDPLGVGVDVHLHHACLDGVADVLQGGAGAAVEDEGHRLVAVAAQLLLEMKTEEKTRREDISNRVTFMKRMMKTSLPKPSVYSVAPTREARALSVSPATPPNNSAHLMQWCILKTLLARQALTL